MIHPDDLTPEACARSDREGLRLLGFLLVIPAILWGCVWLGGCAALSRVTPADRAAAYAIEAKGMAATCAAYKFDRAQGLVTDVPEMTERCR